MNDIDIDSIAIEDVAVPPALPSVGPDTAALADDAVDSLVAMRFPLSAGDARATLHALTSLADELASRLADSAADARDQGASWEEIATCLGTSAGTARRRYATFVANRPVTPMD
jgi:hypothetical protein